MNKFLMSAAALAMVVPGVAMAANDTEGTFSASMTVQPPTGVTVQVVGLNDFEFGTINTTNTSGTTVTASSNHICLLRSDPGDVSVNIVQTNLPAGQSFALQGTIDTNQDGSIDNIPVTVSILNPGGGGATMSNNLPTNFVQSGTGCSAAGIPAVVNNPLIAHELNISPSTLPAANTLRLEGLYTALFTITVSVP